MQECKYRRPELSVEDGLTGKKGIELRHPRLDAQVNSLVAKINDDAAKESRVDL